MVNYDEFVKENNRQILLGKTPSLITKECTIKHNIENNGGTTSYYDTPTGNTTLNDLIEHKQMQFWQGEIMKAIYGLDGRIDKNGGSETRELNKIVYYVNRRLAMLGLPKYSVNE